MRIRASSCGTLPGLPPPTHAPPSPTPPFKGAEEPHPVLLTRKGTDALVRVERLLDDANRALAATRRAAGTARRARWRQERNRRHDIRDRGGPRSRRRLSRRLATIAGRARAATIELIESCACFSGPVSRLLIAAAIGLGATWLTLTRGVAFGSLRIGAWTAWPKSGSVDIDPYARATIARSGELPIGHRRRRRLLRPHRRRRTTSSTAAAPSRSAA